ncbi:MAG: hypothetical protein EOP54_03590 [Sphingobacteriales bacterium]|nr:MAG: hypothetical protein EOP54_03590 [Sphingobacteriales bacterium]
MLTMFNWLRGHKTIAAFCFYTWAAIIFAACLLPGKDVPSLSVFQYDKVIHFAIFALMAFLFLLLFSNPVLKKEGLIVFLSCTAYGYCVELLQGSGITEGRSFDHYDALADAVGTALGVVLFFTFKHFGDKQKAKSLLDKD